MSALTLLLSENPVFVKEMRTRMRGVRAYWVLAGYLGVLSLILFFRYSLWWHEAQMRGGLSSQSKIGQEFFGWIIGTQAFLVAFITPAVTSGAITIEREQRTMEMLEMTRLSRGAIIAGKLIAAVSFVALLLVSSLPLTSICFFLGGVSPDEVLYAYLMLLAGSLVAGSLGLAWSTVARTTSSAVLYTYGSMLAPLFLIFAYAGVASAQGGSAAFGSLALTIAIAALYGFRVPDTGGQIGAFLSSWDMRHYYGLTLPAWLGPLLTYTLLGVVLAVVAAERLEPTPGRRSRLLRWLIVAFIAQQAFFFFGARFSVYGGAATPGMATYVAAFPLLNVLAYPVLLLLAVVPILTTGEVRPLQARRFARYLAGGWTRAAWRRGTLSSGPPLVLTLGAVILGLYALSFVFIGQPGAAASGRARLMAPAVAAGPPWVGGYGSVPPYSGLPAPGPVRTEDAYQLPKAAAAIVSSLLGLSALGLLVSLLVRNRWAAMGVSYAVLLAILMAPVVAQINYLNDPGQGPPSALVNLFYLSPLTCIAELTGAAFGGSGRVPLLFGATPIWLVTVVSHLFVAGLSLLAAVPLVAQTAARRGSPYDDLGVG